MTLNGRVGKHGYGKWTVDDCEATHKFICERPPGERVYP